MNPETLETAQQALREKSQEARKKAKKRTQVRGVMFTPRVRESIETTLKSIAQNPGVDGKHRVEAARLLCQITGKIPMPVQEPKNDEPAPNPPVPREQVQW